MELVAKGLQRTSGSPVREPGVWGKHRTEVTDATEGELGWVAKSLQRTSGSTGARTRWMGEASHRGHRGHGGAIGIGGERSSEGIGVYRCENQVYGESIAQGHRGE